MHQEQIKFCRKVKAYFKESFRNCKVLDCGSLDINGNNRYLFDNCYYTGVDLGAGDNVDIVKPVHELDYPDGFFDTIISTEMLEHDQYFEKSLANMIRMLKGLLLITCATTGRTEHGTTKSLPGDSPFTNHFYQNVTEQQLSKILSKDIFYKFHFEVNNQVHDLYFWGIKKLSNG